MFIVEVIPLAFIPGNQSQVLSYFCNEMIKTGVVVEIPFNYRRIEGVVVNSEPIKNRKLDFKKGVSFELKKISKIINSEPQISKKQLITAKYISDYYYAPLGVCLKTILPPFWGKKNYKLEVGNYGLRDKQKSKITTGVSLESDFRDRHSNYKKEILKKIKNGQQVFLMVAENTIGQYFLEKLKDLKPEFISSSVKNKKYYEIWQKITLGEPMLIIGTRTGLFLPFTNLGLIIVDDESNEFYKSDMTPRYHGADLAKFVARINNSDLIFNSTVPRIETIFSVEKKFDFSKKNKFQNRIKIIDSIREIKSANFSIFSRELKDFIWSLKTNAILFVPRRGSANFVSCQNCGHSITCPNCNVSLVVHKSMNDKPVLICHHCVYRQEILKACPSCGSYKLKAIGVGTEKVVEELEKLKKYNNLNFKIFKLDSDESGNIDKNEREIIEKFNQNQPAILVATQIIFSHKDLLKSEFIGIINADSLISIPDFRVEELTFRQITTLKEMTENLIIQTRNPDNQTIKLASMSSFQDFFKQEIENRKIFSYPPFSQLLKLTFKDRNLTKARNESNILYQKLKHEFSIKKYEIEVDIIEPNQAFIGKERGLYVFNIILKIKTADNKITSEQIKSRNELLRLVPGGWGVDIDPKNII